MSNTRHSGNPRGRFAHDLSGKMFGMLLVVEKAKTNHLSKAMWLCLCECGGQITTLAESLRSGGTTSCGCKKPKKPRSSYVLSEAGKEAIRHKNSLPSGEAAWNKVINMYKKCAKQRGHSFELTDSEVKALTSGNCTYCGTPPAKISRPKNDKNGVYPYNGIDRIDSYQGYLLNNVVTCCNQCNVAKMDKPMIDFIQWIHRASAHLKSDITIER